MSESAEAKPEKFIHLSIDANAPLDFGNLTETAKMQVQRILIEALKYAKGATDGLPEEHQSKADALLFTYIKGACDALQGVKDDDAQETFALLNGVKMYFSLIPDGSPMVAILDHWANCKSCGFATADKGAQN